LGAIQTATKRLNQIISEQQKKKDKNFKGLYAFKVLNVNDYDVFKNELEAKEIIMEMYGVEPIKRSYFDGVLDNNFVKAMPLNRVLNKMDIRATLKEVENNISVFNVKKKSKSGEPVYEEGVLIIASGVELDVSDFLKKENKTGVKVEIRDILTDKKNLIFKKKPEAKMDVKAKDKKLSVELKEFYSPILMRKLELENGKMLKKEHQAKVTDFKQIIDSVAIDVDYNGKLFNAEVMDLPSKKELIKAKYGWEYQKKGKYIVAVKIVDVLGEEYFETFEVSA
jgi:site-specific DNA-methyltransferase (adenine-specific)/adenine-specific DNA-methyltransferase